MKVTLSLSRRSVEFFKREAGKSRVPYQRMIRALVDAYAARAGKGRALGQGRCRRHAGPQGTAPHPASYDASRQRPSTDEVSGV